MRRRIFAWAAHGYTATGFLLAAGAAVLIVRGGAADFRWAFLLLAVAVVVDATDGWIARKARAAELLPGFDGRRLDDLVDFHTYVSLPLLLLWRAGIPDGPLGWALLVPLLAGAYGFSQSEAKTGDGFFLGFPSCWNVVAFYLYFLDGPTWFALLVLGAFSLLTFVPTPYLYATRRGPWSAATCGLGGVWGVVVLLITLGLLPREDLWVRLSLLFPAYYLGMSWTLGLRRRVRAPGRTSA